MSSSADDNLYIYYVPNQIVAVVLAIVFVVLCLLHLWKMIATQQWFGFAILIGGIFEVLALAARTRSHYHPDETKPYIIQYVLILLAPILFTAGVYMFLGRLIRVSGHPELSFIRINWITKIFVLGDILCFFIQAVAGCIIASLVKSTASDVSQKMNMAENIILAGLGLQVGFFCIFALCALVFHIRVSKSAIARTVDPTLHLHVMLFTIYAAAVLITVRNAYRLVEYKTGTTGYFQTHEWPGYALDVALMAVFMLISFFWYAADTKARLNGKYDSYGKENTTHYGSPYGDSYNLAAGKPYVSTSSNVPSNASSNVQVNANGNPYGNGYGYGNSYGRAYGNV
ncbi:RTA1 like protein [Penicillium hispanicum]|uniref:RTA1 like protein n=1 Tax=Penicillium hispanicum TaxID=1080232 RepID=UPI0025426824|nr:RTA1 like protein [Penicillium hispanicum]KAJ5585062.1 RTA1 like protein [Penicillium hispanicum]